MYAQRLYITITGWAVFHRFITHEFSMQTDRQANRQTGRQTGRHTGGQIRQADRPEIQPYRHIYRE